MEIKFREWNCLLEKGNYRNNDRVALTLIDAEDGSPVATATVNLINEVLEENEVAIKTGSENEGMYQALHEAGVIGDVKRYAFSGFNKYPICELLIK